MMQNLSKFTPEDVQNTYDCLAGIEFRLEHGQIYTIKEIAKRSVWNGLTSEEKRRVGILFSADVTNRKQPFTRLVEKEGGSNLYRFN